MPEAKTKKVRVYKLASEYNLSAENLIEFLQKKRSRCEISYVDAY